MLNKENQSSTVNSIFAPFSTVSSTLATAALCIICFCVGTVVEKNLFSNEARQEAMIKCLKSDVRFWKLVYQGATSSSLQDKIKQLEEEQKRLEEENSSLKKQNDKLSQVTEVLSEGISALDTKVRYIKSEQQ